MLARYEQTKPEDQQVGAAIKQRNRTKFRWGTTPKSTKSTSSLTPHSTPSPPPPSAKSTSRRSRKPFPTLPPITESELEDCTSDEDTGHSPATSFASSTSSSVSLHVDSRHSLSPPDVALTTAADPAPAPALVKPTTAKKNASMFMPRIEYNMRKLLREVMGRDGVWTSDHQVMRHYARINWGVVTIEADGNCLFRAISDQLYGTEIYHGDIRRRIVDFIRRDGRVFQPFIATEASAESLEQYCERMKREGEWGGNPELYAAAKLFNVQIVVHQGPMRRVRIENGRTGSSKSPPPYQVLHLLFKSDHYNSLHPPPKSQEKWRKNAPFTVVKRSAPSSQQSAKEQQLRSARDHDLRQPEPSKTAGEVSKANLGNELRVDFEEADAHVVRVQQRRQLGVRAELAESTEASSDDPDLGNEKQLSVGR